ncbi:mucin TcMUCII, putative [Trypanosoma cruzi marinkellei]|uniref:Mucin TcMUCII, putative n=1 Tax=Trypanosoma cruzi marinkellei TaxID=85056 RepID=K2MVP1_TRYCR|nr:mucin TcMUCII, putative [Trypanosoma cruzi marinkellei]
MMMTCRLLCALLVLALCCCPSVYATLPESPGPSSQTTTANNTTQPPSEETGPPGPLNAEPLVEQETTGDKEAGSTALDSKSARETVILQEESAEDKTGAQIGTTISKAKKVMSPNLLPRRPRQLQQRHQRRLRPQRRQLRQPLAHRHVLAKSTAASAALRGCVPRCCTPHPHWRTPLCAEELCAGCACQHSATVCVYVYCGPMYKVTVIMMIVFCSVCFCCPAVCSALLLTSVTLNASQTIVCTTLRRLFEWTHR